jgi:hypothetical protein
VCLLLSLAAYRRTGSDIVFGLPQQWLTMTGPVPSWWPSHAIRWFDGEVVVGRIRIDPFQFAFASLACAALAAVLTFALLRNGIPPTGRLALITAGLACLSGVLVAIDVPLSIKLASLLAVQAALVFGCWRYRALRPFAFLHLLAITSYWWSIRLPSLFVETGAKFYGVGKDDVFTMSQGLAISMAITSLVLGGRWTAARITRKNRNSSVDLDSA